MTTFLSLHAATRDETRRQTAVAEALRGRRHTRATVAAELAQPAEQLPPIYRSLAAGQDEEVRRG